MARSDRVESAASRAHRRTLIDELSFELVPMKSITEAIEALPTGARVSVTCSPAKGIEATLRVCEDLVGRGFAPVPHLAARMVADRAHTRAIAGWFREVGLSRAFVVGGDADVAGDYADGASFLRDLLETDHPLTHVGLPGYPDGHPLIAPDTLDEALRHKRELLAQAGVAGSITTQMCFDPGTVAAWLRRRHEVGVDLPVELGVAGVVEKRKLMTLGMRLGIGQSLRYVRKNRAAVTRMLTSTAYDPNDLLVPLGRELMELDVVGLHAFTFNQVAATDAWRRRAVRTERRGFSRRIPSAGH